MSTTTITGTQVRYTFTGPGNTLVNLGTLTGPTPVYSSFSGDMLINSGRIGGGATSGDSVQFRESATVTNLSTGTIAGSLGIFGLGALTVDNSGVIGIAATNANGIFMFAGGRVTNRTGGTITGATAIGAAYAAATVTNSGVIGSGSTITKYGVVLLAGGSVTNQSGGTIAGKYGVQIKGAAGTVTNSGSISGSEFAVQLAAGFTNLVRVGTDAAFSGQVSGGNTLGSSIASTLALRSGASIGTLTSFGSRYVNFSRVTVETGASWHLANASNSFVSGVSLRNLGTVAGNAGASTQSSSEKIAETGEFGIRLAGGTLTNDLLVAGGNGGSSTLAEFLGVAGDGGAGVVLTANGTVTNNGTIRGGGAGNVSGSILIEGATGGAGLVISNGRLVNAGTAVGGVGGTARGDFMVYGGTGGVGVTRSGTGGTIVNSGSITGGAGGYGLGDAQRLPNRERRRAGAAWWSIPARGGPA